MQFSYLSGKLRVQKRSVSEWLVLWILIFPFIFGFMREILHIPSFVRFSLDLVLVVLFGFAIVKQMFSVRQNVLPLFVLVSVFFMYTLVVYLLNFQSPFYYIWGFRNNFRFYVAFFSFVAYLCEDSAQGLLKLLDFFFWMNAAVTVVQFFFLDVSQDYLGGLFGSDTTTNAYTLLFLAIIATKSLLSTFNGTEKPITCVLKCATSLMVAAMAELKFYFILFIFLLILTSLLTRLSKRKIFIILASVLAIFLGYTVLVSIFSQFEGFLNFRYLIDAAFRENYSTQGTLNRMSAIPTLMKNYVTEPIQQWFGLGLGNCDVSEVSIFNSPYYQQHSHLLYIVFSSATLFLETGFVGLAIYLSFFVICSVYCLRKLRNGEGNRLFCQMGIVVSVICVILTFYNASMRTEPAYMAYFILSLPFLSRTKTIQNSVEFERGISVEK